MKSLKHFAHLCLVSTSFLIRPLGAAEEAKQVPPVMYEFMGNLYWLQPLMFSQSAFRDIKNEARIKEALSGLSSSSKRLPHSQRLSTSSFQVSATALQAHLTELSSAFGEGRKEYARRMLVATLDGCSSCHTQVPGRSLPAWTFRKEEMSGGAYEQGEFLFAVRHYDEALKHFSEFIRAFDPKTQEVLQLENALRRELVIFVRVLRDPSKGLQVLKPQIGNPALPKHVRTDMRGWMEGLEKLAKNPPPDALKATREDVEAYARKTINPLLEKKGLRFEPSSFIAFLAASGVIFDFINNRSEKDLSPDLLYLLARCDSQISQGYFFSLTDNYLRECIVRFPATPMAKTCYDELEASMTQAYTGSAGTAVPKSIKDELKQLRKSIKP